MKFKAVQAFLKTDLTHHYKKRKHVFNQAAIMAGARVLGMAFGAAGTIWAARCMGPHNYGISGMVQSLVVQISMIFAIIHQTVLIREYKSKESTKEREHLVRVSTTFRFWTVVLVCLVATLAMLFHLVPSIYDFAGWLFLPLIFLNSLQPLWLFQASEHQHFQSMIAVFQPAFSATLYFIFFKPGMSAGSDLVVTAISAFIILFIYWFSAKKLGIFSGNPIIKLPFDQILKLIKESKWLFASSLSVYVYTALELPLVGWLYSIDELGKYRTSFSAVNAAQAIFMIVPTILYPRFLEWRKRGELFLWKRQLKLAALFSVIGLIVGIAAWFIIPILYPIFFGPLFISAAIPCVILVFSKLVEVVSGIFFWGLVTDKKHDHAVSISMISIGVFSLIGNFILIPKFGMRSAVLISLLSQILILSSCMFFSFRKIRIINGSNL